MILQCFFTQDKILICIIVNLSSRRFMNTSTENYRRLAAFCCSPPPLSYIFFFLSLGGLWIPVRRTIDALLNLLHPSPLPYIFICLGGLWIRVRRTIDPLLHLLHPTPLPYLFIIRRFMHMSTDNSRRFAASVAALLLCFSYFLSLGGLWIRVRWTIYAYCILLHPPSLSYIFISLAGLGIHSFAHRSFAHLFRSLKSN